MLPPSTVLSGALSSARCTGAQSLLQCAPPPWSTWGAAARWQPRNHILTPHCLLTAHRPPVMHHCFRWSSLGHGLEGLLKPFQCNVWFYTLEIPCSTSTPLCAKARVSNLWPAGWIWPTEPLDLAHQCRVWRHTAVWGFGCESVHVLPWGWAAAVGFLHVLPQGWPWVAGRS